MEVIREKIITFIMGTGFIGMLIFASAIDGPDNDLRVVAAGMFTSCLMLSIGGRLADYYGIDFEYEDEYEDEFDDEDF